MRKISTLLMSALVAVGLVLSGCSSSSDSGGSTSIAATAVSITNGATAVVVTGGTLKLAASLTPANSTDTINWTVSADDGSGTLVDTTLATLSATTGGSVTLTAGSTTGEVVVLAAVSETVLASITVTIAVPNPASAVAIDQGATASTDYKTPYTLTATLTATNAGTCTDTVVWSIPADTTIATINASTGVLTPTATGTVVVTATAGSATDTITVTITGVDATLYSSTSLSMNLPVNSTYGYQQISSILPSDFQAKAGDVLYVTIAGTSDVTIDNLKFVLADNGETTGAGWGWVVMTDYLSIGENIVAGTAFETTIAVPITTTSTTAGPNYNKVVLSCGTATASSPTLTLTKFNIVLKVVNPVSTNYVVTYDLANSVTGVSASKLSVVSGLAPFKPANPSITGYDFGGWYQESGWTNAFSYTSPVTADTTVYAKFTTSTLPTATVSFDYNYDSKGTYDTAICNQGATVVAPTTNPTRDGYTFKGWYASSTATASDTSFDFATAISANTTLYARWLAWKTLDLGVAGSGYGITASKVISQVTFTDATTTYGLGQVSFTSADLSGYDSLVINAKATSAVQFSVKLTLGGTRTDVAFPTGDGTTKDYTIDISGQTRTAVTAVGIGGNGTPVAVTINTITFKDTTGVNADKVISLSTAAIAWTSTMSTVCGTATFSGGSQTWWQGGFLYSATDMSEYSQIVINCLGTAGATVGFQLGTAANLWTGGSDLGYPSITASAADYAYNISAITRTAITTVLVKAAAQDTTVTVNSITLK